SQHSFKDSLAAVAGLRSMDPSDGFVLPTGFEGLSDEKLKNAVKMAVMTHIYGSQLPDVAKKLQGSWAEYGPGLGEAENIERLFQKTRVGELVGVYLPLCEAVADCADPYAGVTLTDPYDRARIVWNPVRRRLHHVTRRETKVYAMPA